jgi:hypothetical protein
MIEAHHDDEATALITARMLMTVSSISTIG